MTTTALIIVSFILTLTVIFCRLLAVELSATESVLREVKRDCIRAENECIILNKQLLESFKLYSSKGIVSSKQEGIHIDKVKQLIILAVNNDNENEARNAAMNACKKIAKDMGLK